MSTSRWVSMVERARPVDLTMSRRLATPQSAIMRAIVLRAA
ncbi:hypothetical protein [Mycolicibacterium brisbanense]|nr:hypothetical protein [Mycolicibacterium brisbanense]